VRTVLKLNFLKHGFGLWAVEIPESFRSQASSDLPSRVLKLRSRPASEIGWRLDAEHWKPRLCDGRCAAALAFGFRSLHVEEIVSSTVPGNVRSRRVMKNRYDALGK